MSRDLQSEIENNDQLSGAEKAILSAYANLASLATTESEEQTANLQIFLNYQAFINSQQLGGAAIAVRTSIAEIVPDSDSQQAPTVISFPAASPAADSQPQSVSYPEQVENLKNAILSYQDKYEPSSLTAAQNALLAIGINVQRSGYKIANILPETWRDDNLTPKQEAELLYAWHYFNEYAGKLHNFDRNKQLQASREERINDGYRAEHAGRIKSRVEGLVEHAKSLREEIASISEEERQEEKQGKVAQLRSVLQQVEEAIDYLKGKDKIEFNALTLQSIGSSRAVLRQNTQPTEEAQLLDIGPSTLLAVRKDTRMASSLLSVSSPAPQSVSGQPQFPAYEQLLQADAEFKIFSEPEKEKKEKYDYNYHQRLIGLLEVLQAFKQSDEYKKSSDTASFGKVAKIEQKFDAVIAEMVQLSSGVEVPTAYSRSALGQEKTEQTENHTLEQIAQRMHISNVTYEYSKEALEGHFDNASKVANRFLFLERYYEMNPEKGQGKYSAEMTNNAVLERVRAILTKTSAVLLNPPQVKKESFFRRGNRPNALVGVYGKHKDKLFNATEDQLNQAFDQEEKLTVQDSRSQATEDFDPQQRVLALYNAAIEPLRGKQIVGLSDSITGIVDNLLKLKVMLDDNDQLGEIEVLGPNGVERTLSQDIQILAKTLFDKRKTGRQPLSPLYDQYEAATGHNVPQGMFDLAGIEVPEGYVPYKFEDAQQQPQPQSQQQQQPQPQPPLQPAPYVSPTTTTTTSEQGGPLDVTLQEQREQQQGELQQPPALNELIDDVLGGSNAPTDNPQPEPKPAPLSPTQSGTTQPGVVIEQHEQQQQGGGSPKASPKVAPILSATPVSVVPEGKQQQTEVEEDNLVHEGTGHHSGQSPLLLNTVFNGGGGSAQQPVSDTVEAVLDQEDDHTGADLETDNDDNDSSASHHSMGGKN